MSPSEGKGPGRFISLEGGEGVGKSTQAKALAAALRARGHDVIETREPGGSEGAEAIRRLLLEGSADRWTPGAEALLFAAARADHVAKTIRPAIAAGRWVLCDRFLDSSLAYQGGGDGPSVEQIRALHQVGSGGLQPDRTLLLTLPMEEAQRRAEARDRGASDRIGGRDTAFHLKVAEAFTALATDSGGRMRIVDALGTPEAVTARLLTELEGL
jgi:dTMP kinase